MLQDNVTHNCNETLSPCQDGDDESERVPTVSDENAAGGRLSVGEASRLLQLSERQVQRLKRRYRPIPSAGCSTASRTPMPWALPVPRGS